MVTSKTVWHGHSTQPSLPAGTARKGKENLLHGRQNRLIIPPAKKNRAFPTGNALLHEVHREVFPAQLLQFGIVGQSGSDPVREQQPHQRKHQRSAQHQKQPGGGGTAGFLRLFLPQLPGEQGVQTHGSDHANGDHQKLDGIYKRGGSQGRFRQTRHKNAVYDVVQRLDEQRQHQRYRHGVQQGADGHFRQFVFRIHRSSFFGQTKKREIVEG